MSHFVRSMGLALVLITNANAAKMSTSQKYTSYQIPVIPEASFEDPTFQKEKKEWVKQKRKLANASTFSGSDLSHDFKKLREEWLQVKSGDQMEALLSKSHIKYNSYSEDTKYFLAQMHVALPLRGIVWRLRPLFENSKGFLGNKSTHVIAVQAVRNTITSLKMFLPTNQTDAAIQYFTEPSVEMSKQDQFKSIAEFQKFMVDAMVPMINESAERITTLAKNSSDKVFVWDNKMAFGRGTFEDEMNRFVGNGPAEINFAIATLYRAAHNILVYCAYNQDHSIKMAGEIGSHFGIDSSIFSSRKNDLGMTDQEKIKLFRSAIQKNHYLELRNYDGSQYGSQLLKQAYTALKNSVVFSERSYEYLQGQDSSKSMSLNPILFQPEIAPKLDKGLKNIKAVVSGPAEVRDPVTGDTVTLNLPAFYKEPPHSLGQLMATGFESGDIDKKIKNKKGETLVVRNYLHGRSIAWDNSTWKKYVPSAADKKPNYMSEAHRIIKYSLGTSMVFGLPELFVH